jgi:hypothetical protein
MAKGRIRDPFIDALSAPKPSKSGLPPVPKSIRKYEKKKPAQKLKEYGFIGASVNDHAVAEYHRQRAAAQTQVVNRLNTQRAEPISKAIVERDKARAEVARIEAIPWGKRPKGWVPALTAAKKKADYPGPKSDAIWRAIQDALTSDKTKDYLRHRPGETTQVAGITTAGPVGDLLNFGGKVIAGIPAGLYGAARHPFSGPKDIAGQAASLSQTLGMLTSSPVSGAAQEKLWHDYIDQSLQGINKQYGPNTSWRSSLKQSEERPVSAVLTGVGAVAPIVKAASIFGALGEGGGLGAALEASRVPRTPRTLTLRGGSEAMGIPVEAQWSRSPLMRSAIQRPADVISRAISPEARVIGRYSESARAAKITRKNLKRETRRAEAEAASYLKGIGRNAEAEELRAVYMRGKPDNVTEEEWLQARVADVKEMLDGREMILPAKDNPRLTKLRNRVDRLQTKFDKRVGIADERTVARKLQPLRNEERSLKGKIRNARERGLPAEEIAPIEARLRNVQDQLAVARGHDVGPLPASEARSGLQAALEQALPTEQVPVAMQVADQLARAASPDNPDAFFSRITARYAEDPEAVGLDANALLQEAGPRFGMTDRPGLSSEQVERAFNNGYSVSTPDGRRGPITAIDGENQRATITTQDGQHVSVPYEQIVTDQRNPPVFYSKAQRIADDLPPKSSPAQVRAFFTKRGVKPVEMEWTGADDWLDSLEAEGVKSISREDVVHYFNNPLNAFDLNETLWEQGSHSYPTRWGDDRYSGVTVYDTGGPYKELMLQLRGDQVYRSGHIDGVDNPIVQIRFHEVEVDGQRVIFIDEMQSDWGASLRDAGYNAKPKDWEAQLEKVRARRAQLTVDLAHRATEGLGLPYDVYPAGTNEPIAIARGLEQLGHQMDKDWREGQGIEIALENVPPGTLDPSDPRVAAWNEWLATPERLALARMKRHADHIVEKAHELSTKERKLIGNPADQPYKKTWSLLGLKRMVAYAVNEGFDAVAWPQGIVPAVRYKHVEPGDHLEPIGGTAGGEPTQHSQYPDANDYQRGYAYHTTEFATPEAGPTQDVLFGRSDTDRPMSWQGEEHYGAMQYPQGTPMGLTTPARYDKKMLEDLDYEIEELAPGMLIYVETGPFANQFIRVAHLDEDGIEAFPSGIKSIDVRGSSDGDGNWADYEIEIVHANGTEYLGGSSLESALTDRYGSRSGEWADLADSRWFDDMETHIDRGWEYETDDDMYGEAVDSFMEQWENGQIEPEGGYDDNLIFDPEEIAQLSVGDYEGLSDLYGKVIPSVARKEWEKKYGVTIDGHYVHGKFTTEGQGAISERGRIPTWQMRIPAEMAEDVRAGQTFFQTATPVSDTMGVEIKGAVELMANRKYRLTLFNGADISTVIHELGHVAVHDLDPESLNTIERDLASGRPLAEWTRDDHERFARAWERFFSEGYASTTSLRRAFGKIMDWMRRIYYGLRDLNEPMTPEVVRVFEKRLGKVGVDEADRRIPDPELQRWGVLLSHAKDELESYEMRSEIARNKGTDEAIRAEIQAYRTQQEVARSHNDLDQFNDLTGKIRAAEKELADRDALQGARGERRQKLLATRLAELNKALKKPDARRYAGATVAAYPLPSEREWIPRNVFGDAYDEVFAGRRAQESEWLAARGHLDEELAGEGHGFLPFRRPSTVPARVKEAAASMTRKVGKPKTDQLNLHTRNQMILWQQGDYSASIEVLHEQYLRALSFAVQHDLRELLYEVGEPVDVTGPKEGWYLIDLDATPLPREWKSANTSNEIQSNLESVLDGLTADDSQLALSLSRYVDNWLHQDPARLVPQPEGGFGNVRQVHPNVINQMMLPYTGPMNTVYKAFQVPNTLARLSLIYANPGYIPSNVLANFFLLVAERGVFSLGDMFQGARMVMKDRALARRVGAEMGETHTQAYLRSPNASFANLAQQAERKVANVESFFADDWMRAAAWSGIASKKGYKGRAAQMRLLDAKTEKTRRDRDWVSDKATNAMINFDRLAPWEQKYLRPIVFVWPFIRGAVAWPLDYTMEHPFRAGAAAAISGAGGQAGQDELGKTPVYYRGKFALLDKEGATGTIADMGSVSPLGPFADFVQTIAAQAESATGGPATGPFLNLAGFLAPQYDAALQLIQNRGDFGEEKTTKAIAIEQASSFIPGLGIFNDMLDETKPAIQMDQGIIDTLKRRTLRFSPQKVNLAILNQQAQERGAAKTVSQRRNEEVKSARTAWNHVDPGSHMPRIVEQSIEAYYSVQEIRSMLKEELKHQRDYQPSKREPTLTPLQETAIVYDVFSARFPEATRGIPDPQAILDQYGEAGLNTYRGNLERSLFAGKRAADKARAAAKKKAKAAA